MLNIRDTCGTRIPTPHKTVNAIIRGIRKIRKECTEMGYAQKLTIYTDFLLRRTKSVKDYIHHRVITQKLNRAFFPSNIPKSLCVY